MKFTQQQIDDYAAGKLQLMTNRKTGERYFIPATRRSYDKGVTPPAKRAYWRVWYLLNHEERRAKERARYAASKLRVKKGDWPGREKNGAKLPSISQVEQQRILAQLPPVDPKTGRRPRGSLTPAQKKLLKRLNNMHYSQKHRAELNARAREAYHAKKGTGKTGQARLPKTPQAKPKGLLQRLLGWF
jgi:hypothetical protein